MILQRNTFTYTAGTVDTSTNTTTFVFSGTFTITNGSMSFYNVSFDSNSTYITAMIAIDYLPEINPNTAKAFLNRLLNLKAFL